VIPAPAAGPIAAAHAALAWLRRPAGWILVAFIVSRGWAHWAGLRFDMRPLDYFFQYLEADLLRHRLLESLWHLHAQPPAFNAFLGVVLKLFPGHEASVFHMVYIGLGLMMAYAAYALMRRLGVPDKLGAGLVIAFIVSPACLLYEHWLFYAYPIATLLCLAAWSLHRYASEPRFRDGLLFFSVLAGVALTRSLYHLVWLGAIALGVAFVLRQKPGAVRLTLLAAAGPLLLLTALYAKNYAMFGTFSASSWIGMSFAKTTISQLYGPDQRRLYDQGLIDLQSMYPPYHALTFYPPKYREAPHTGVPALDRPFKQGGAVNYNHMAYLPMSKLYMKDSLTTLKHYPKSYLKNLGKTYLIYLRPATDNEFLDANIRPIAPYVSAFERFVYGRLVARGPQVPAPTSMIERLSARFEGVAYGYLLVFPLVWAWGLYRGLQALWRGPAERAFAAAVLFLCFNVIFVTVLGNFVETGENNRFRFDIDMAYLTLLALLLSDGYRAWRERRRAG
jgi:hypothetical protein